MIWSVLIRVVPLPRSAWSNRGPRRGAFATRRTITVFPLSSNSTSVSGKNPALFRMASGMVTWPLLVMRMAPSMEESYQEE